MIGVVDVNEFQVPITRYSLEESSAMLSTPLTARLATPYDYESTRVDVTRYFVREHSCDSEYVVQPQPTAEQPVDSDDDLGIAEAHSVHEALTQLHAAGNQVRLRFLEVLQMLRDNNVFVESDTHRLLSTATASLACPVARRWSTCGWRAVSRWVATVARAVR